MRLWFFLLGCLAFLAACNWTLYQQSEVGTLEGSVAVFWVGEGSPKYGDGEFVLLTPPDAPLTFTRPDSAGGAIIEPDMIYVDGGTIPKFAQMFKGLSPWGYAHAYMVHDWLFVARKCVNDGEATDYQRRIVEDMEFEDQARVIAEVIKTMIAQKMVAPNDVAPFAITSAVQSPVSRALWEERGACARNQISDEHIARIEAAFPGITGRRGAALALDKRAVTPANLIGFFDYKAK